MPASSSSSGLHAAAVSPGHDGAQSGRVHPHDDGAEHAGGAGSAGPRHGGAQVDASGPRRLAAAFRPTRSTRTTHVDSYPDIPFDCTMRKYEPDDGSYRWVGDLPSGVVDDNGRHTRTLTWGFFAGRSEEEAVQNISDWLLQFHDNR